MPARKAEYPSEWLKKAQQDLLRVARRLAEDDREDATFHLQQALEKYLKGYLLSAGWRLKRIHDLEALLDDAVRIDPSFERYRTLCQQVTGYYLMERYPGVGELPSVGQVRSHYRSAQRFARFISQKSIKR